MLNPDRDIMVKRIVVEEFNPTLTAERVARWLIDRVNDAFASQSDQEEDRGASRSILLAQHYLSRATPPANSSYLWSNQT